MILASDMIIPHLHFADDIIIFTKPSLEAVMNLKNTLQVFEIISGFKVN